MFEIISYGHAYVLDDIGWFSGEESFTSWTRKGRSCSCKVFFFIFVAARCYFLTSLTKLSWSVACFEKLTFKQVCIEHFGLCQDVGREQRRVEVGCASQRDGEDSDRHQCPGSYLIFVNCSTPPHYLSL